MDYLTTAHLLTKITNEFSPLNSTLQTCLNIGKAGEKFSSHYSDHIETYDELTSMSMALKKTLSDEISTKIVTSMLSTCMRANPVIGFINLADPLANKIIDSSDVVWKKLIADLEHHADTKSWIQFGLTARMVDATAERQAIATMVTGAADILKKCTGVISRKIYQLFDGYCSIIKTQLDQYSLISSATAGELDSKTMTQLDKNFSELSKITDKIIDPMIESIDLTEPIAEQYEQKIKLVDAHLLCRTEHLIKNALRISDYIADKYKLNSDIKANINKLDDLIDSDAPLDKCIDQRNIIISKITHIEDSNQLLHDFTHGAQAAGQSVASLASLMNNHNLAHHTVNTVNFVVQASMIGCAYNGIGALAGTNPYVLGLMATGACLQFIAGIRQSKNESMTIFLHHMMSTFMQAFEKLQSYLRENFTKLFERLDVMERRIMEKFIDMKHITHLIIDQLTDLIKDSNLHWAFMHDSVSSINDQIESVKSMIVEKDARDTVTSLGHFIATVFHNIDYKLYSEYRNKLIGHLSNCFGPSNASLIGKTFTIDSVPHLSLNSLITDISPNIHSRVLMHEKLSKYSSGVYISPFMNFFQVIVSPVKPHPDYSIITTYFTTFLTSDATTGIFPIDVADCTIIIIINKHSNTGKMHIVNPMPIYICFKIAELISKLDYQFEYVTYVAKNNIVSSYNIIKNFITKTQTNIDVEISEIVQTRDKTFMIVHHHTYHTLFKTLLFTMAKQYIPATKSDAELTFIDHNEIEQLINVGNIIQHNYHCIKQLTNVSHVEKLMDELISCGKAFSKMLTDTIISSVQQVFDKTWPTFINDVVVKYAKCDRFDDPIPLTHLSCWGNGHEDYYNDRNGYSKNNISRNIDGYLSNYRHIVQSGFNEIKKKHRQYVDSEIEKLRKLCCPFRMNQTISYYSHVYQLPFYIIPYEDSLPVLPVSQLLRTMILTRVMKKDEFASFAHNVYHGQGTFSMAYRVITSEDGKLVDNMGLLLHLLYNDNVIAAIILHNYEKTFNGESLNFPDGIFSWIYGGTVVNGSDYVNVENWHSHIPGNHSHCYVHVPRTGVRPALDFESVISIGCISFMDKHKTVSGANQLRKKLVIDGIHNAVKPIIAGNQVNALYKIHEQYLINWRKVETWDYWTFRLIDASMHKDWLHTRSKILEYFEDIGKHISGDLSGCHKIFSTQFNLVPPNPKLCKEYTDKITSSSSCVGYQQMIECMMEGSNVIEYFAPYIVKGDSTPEIARKMSVGIEIALKKMHKLMLYVDKIALTDDKEINIAEVIEELRHAVGSTMGSLKKKHLVDL